MAPKKKTYLSFLVVAAVTFSGGEEIGVYASIFAVHHNVSEIATIFILVMIFTGIWCMMALYLVHHSSLAVHFRKLSRWILPLVLVGIGIYILTEAFIMPLLE
jgi:cadmium resistance protein CadD (predicted permease)